MKVQILGSAAAERYPALWCECEYCRRAKANNEIRRAASLLIDSDTLVDFGPDIHWQVTEFDIDLSLIRRVIITHSHGDHLDPLEFLWRKDYFSKTSHSVGLFGSTPSFAEILSFAARDSNFLSLENDLKLIPHPLRHGSEVEDGDLSIFAMNADHAPGKQPLVYLLSRKGKTVLIGNDSGWFPEPTWKALEGKNIDLAILDCTHGLLYPDCASGHMGANVVLKVRNRLGEMGCMKPGARCVATHFSHNGGGSKAEFEAFFTPNGIETAYDGYTVDLNNA